MDSVASIRIGLWTVDVSKPKGVDMIPNLLDLAKRIRDIDYNIELTDDDKANRILSILGEVYNAGQMDALAQLEIIPNSNKQTP